MLINNAGYGEYGPAEEIPMDKIRKQFETNFFGAVELTQLILPTMRAQNYGRIVNISSIGGDVYMHLVPTIMLQKQPFNNGQMFWTSKLLNLVFVPFVYNREELNQAGEISH